MAPVPLLSAAEVVNTLVTHFQRTVARSGNHIATLSVPNHSTVARGTLRSLLRAAQISVDEFVAARRR